MVTLYSGAAARESAGAFFGALTRSLGEGRRVLLFVPEQFSYESERAVLELVQRGGQDLEVLTFRKLSERYGDPPGGRPVLRDEGRYALMALAIAEAAGELRFFRRSAQLRGFPESMIDCAAQFKNAGLGADALRELCGGMSDVHLRDKLREIAAILGAYERRTAAAFCDPGDLSAALQARIRESGDLRGAALYFQSFSDFTAAEAGVIKALLSVAESASFHFQVPAAGGDSEAFRPAHRAMDWISEAARGLGHAVERLEARAGDPAPLPFLREFFLTDEPVSAPSCVGISLVACRDAYAEAERAAADIRRLVQDEGYRYRDIAVVVRDAAAYDAPLSLHFARQDIPFFCDRPVPLATGAVARFFELALAVIAGSFRAEDLLRYLKTGLLSLTPMEIGLFENYLFALSLSGVRLKQPFRDGAEGIDLGEAERVRALAVGPLALLEQELRGAGGAARLRALWRFGEQAGARAVIERQMAEQPIAAARDIARQWSALASLFEGLAAALGDTEMPLRDFAAIFQGALRRADYGQVERSLDEVEITESDRSRTAEKRAVFLLGCAEGQFPREQSAGSVLSDRDLDALRAAGFELAGGADYRLSRELYGAYRAAALAQDRLQLSYSQIGDGGERQYPSLLFSELRALFPALAAEQADRADPVSLVGTEASALALYARELAGKGPRRADFDAALPPGDLKAALENTPQEVSYRLFDRALRERLFPRLLTWAPSNLERFFDCHFRFFCADVLNIRPLRKKEINPLTRGNALHACLEALFAELPHEALLSLSGEELDARCRAIVAAYFAREFGEAAEGDPRLRHNMRRILDQFLSLARRLQREFLGSDFQPFALEMSLSEEGDAAPMQIAAPGDRLVRIFGKIDRVDVLRRGEKLYVRVVDYKSGVKKFSLEHLLAGLDMQMLLYLFAIWEEGRGVLRGAIPAGVLYMPARSRAQAVGEGAPEAEIARLREAEFRMSGVLLGEPEVVAAMERDRSGTFLPVSYKGNELQPSDRLLSLGEMGLLKTYLQDRIRGMVAELLRGEIEPLPLDRGEDTACRTCDYRMICKKEPGGAVRAVPKLGGESFFQAIGGVKP